MLTTPAVRLVKNLTFKIVMFLVTTALMGLSTVEVIVANVVVRVVGSIEEVVKSVVVNFMAKLTQETHMLS